MYSDEHIVCMCAGTIVCVCVCVLKICQTHNYYELTHMLYFTKWNLKGSKV